MLARIIRHEWTLLAADRTAVLIVVMFTALIGAAAISGLRAVRTADQTVTAVLTAQDDRLREARDTLTGPGASGDATWGPASPAWLGGFVGRYLAQPTAPLAALATGQTDLNAPYARVTARGREAIAPPMQTGNPLLLHLGQFDLAFVLVYLYPLFVLALAYDLTSTEREDGTLRLIASQPVTLRQVVIGTCLVCWVVTILQTVTGTLRTAVPRTIFVTVTGTCLMRHSLTIFVICTGTCFVTALLTIVVTTYGSVL